jgi:hypothetical protein
MVSMPLRPGRRILNSMENTMHQPQALKTLSLVSVTAAATMLLIQACGGGAIAQSDDNDPIIGVWDDVVTARNCATGAVLGTFRAIGIAHRGGTFQGDNAAPPTTRGAAFGTWKRESGSDYTGTLVFMRFGPDLTMIGTTKVVAKRTLSADGNSYTGSLVRREYNLDGVQTLEGCGSTAGKRITFW